MARGRGAAQAAPQQQQRAVPATEYARSVVVIAHRGGQLFSYFAKASQVEHNNVNLRAVVKVDGSEYRYLLRSALPRFVLDKMDLDVAAARAVYDSAVAEHDYPPPCPDVQEGQELDGLKLLGPAVRPWLLVLYGPTADNKVRRAMHAQRATRDGI